MQNFYENCPVIKTGCVVAVQNFEEKGKLKALCGDLRIGPSGQFVLTGVMMDKGRLSACLFDSAKKDIDIFPNSSCHDPKKDYGTYCCVTLEIPFKASKKFVDYVSESSLFGRIEKVISQVV